MQFLNYTLISCYSLFKFENKGYFASLLPLFRQFIIGGRRRSTDVGPTLIFIFYLVVVSYNIDVRATIWQNYAIIWDRKSCFASLLPLFRQFIIGVRRRSTDVGPTLIFIWSSCHTISTAEQLFGTIRLSYHEGPKELLCQFTSFVSSVHYRRTATFADVGKTPIFIFYLVVVSNNFDVGATIWHN